MLELRRYSREVVDLVCVFYALSQYELPAKILNLSETGVLLELDYNDNLISELKLGDFVQFQSRDCFDKTKNYIFQERSSVVRIEVHDNKIRIACEVSGRDSYYNKYVKGLKAFRKNENN